MFIGLWCIANLKCTSTTSSKRAFRLVPLYNHRSSQGSLLYQFLYETHYALLMLMCVCACMYGAIESPTESMKEKSSSTPYKICKDNVERDRHYAWTWVVAVTCEISTAGVLSSV